MMQFKRQMEEDIQLIQNEWIDIDSKISKPEYAFNYWILSRIYSIDEDLIPTFITEYNDKSIDCYVHYPEVKQLYLIQNKYYKSTQIKREQISDFLKTPLAILNNGTYKRSSELQKIFNQAKKDSEYEIYLHFYCSDIVESTKADIKPLFDDFRKMNKPKEIAANLFADFFDACSIKDKYYNDRIKEQIDFKCQLNTINKGTSLDIRPENYNLPNMIKSHYIMVPVIELYEMYRKSKEIAYPLFEENIREFLGAKGVNSGIIKTLKSKEDRNNFFYYNNGITIICDDVKKVKSNQFNILNPQIVNGCQTMNSIYYVLNLYNIDEIKKEFKDTYIMVKLLLLEKDKGSKNLYQDIVKYTNKQNSISDKAFVSNDSIFYTLQTEFLERGLVLLVKPSDKNKYTEIYKKNEMKFNQMKKKAKRFTKYFDIEISKPADLFIDLEKLLQVVLAFCGNGYLAFTKKAYLLKKDSSIYNEYTATVIEHFTTDKLIYLFFLYKKAELQKKQSADKKSPVPYYVVDFFSRGCNTQDNLSIETLINKTFTDHKVTNQVYTFIEKWVNAYKRYYMKEHKCDFNTMIKREIDEDIMNFTKENLRDALGELEPLIETSFFN